MGRYIEWQKRSWEEEIEIARKHGGFSDDQIARLGTNTYCVVGMKHPDGYLNNRFLDTFSIVVYYLGQSEDKLAAVDQVEACTKILAAYDAGNKAEALRLLNLLATEEDCLEDHERCLSILEEEVEEARAGA